MSLSQDLMGLGISPLQAAHTASGGTGPLTLGISTVAAGLTGATSIGAYQFCVSIIATGTTSTCGVKLPPVGSDNGCLLADDFIINNAGATTMQVFTPVGTSGNGSILISCNGSNNSFQIVPVHTSLAVFPVSTTQWIGVRGS